jgi:hypothetical protein
MHAAATQSASAASHAHAHGSGSPGSGDDVHRSQVVTVTLCHPRMELFYIPAEHNENN